MSHIGPSSTSSSNNNMSGSSVIVGISPSTSMPSSPLPQHQLPREGHKQNSINILRRSRNRRRAASIETSSPSMGMVATSSNACNQQVDKLSVRDVSIEVQFDQSLCVDMGRNFRRDSLLLSKKTYMSKSSENLIGLHQADSCVDQLDVPTTTTIPEKRRVRFAEMGKVKIISRIDDIDPQAAENYWYSKDDRTRNEQNTVEEAKIFRKLHKITKRCRRQSLQEGSKSYPIQRREEELLWAVIDAKSYCVRGLEHLIDRRMRKKMKEEQDNAIYSILQAQAELGPSSHGSLASVSASLTKNARLRASFFGMEDQEAILAMRWEEAQQEGGKESCSSLRAL